MDVDLYNLKNEKVGTLAVPEKVFHAKWNAALVKQVLLAQLANRRRPWAHAKGRSEVRGGGRKPWRQKGTGRARHGSIRSPLWRGGGKAHGPSSERDYSQKVNKKMKRAALFSIMSKRLKEHEVKFFDSLDIEAPKTKVLAGNLKPFTGAATRKKTTMSILLIPDAGNKMLPRAGANLPRVKVVSPKSLTPHDLLKYQHIFIDQRAVQVLEEQFVK